jgi:hypothetical protein
MAVIAVRAAGSPYEVGHATGAAVADRVHAAVDAVCRFDADPAAVRARLGELVAVLAAAHPEALEEARGVADGAGVEVDEALLLSFCTEIDGALPGFCSLLAAAGPDGPLLGKNLDAPAALGPLQIVQHVAPDDGLPYTHLTTAGALWTDGGVNAAGLALVNASLAARGRVAHGVPDGYRVRQTLAACGTVDEAVAHLTSAPVRSAGENVLLADADGRTALVQVVPGRHAAAVDLDLPAVACNRAHDPGVGAEQPDDDPVRDNSDRRESALRARAAGAAAWHHADVFDALADPGVRLEGADGLWTLATLAIDPADRRLEISDRDAGSTGARSVHRSEAPIPVHERGEGRP